MIVKKGQVKESKNIRTPILRPKKENQLNILFQ